MLLSIITINYNNLEGLKRTVESVVNQTWNQFEYLIIDGGSTDGSIAYIKNQSDKIDYWVSEPDKGIYNAMNKGILKTKGEYLLFLNSGDHFFDQNVLEKTHVFLGSKDLVYFNLKVIDSKNEFIKKYSDQLSFSYFLNDTLPHPATFIKKNLFDKIGLFDETLKIVSDWKFFIESICKHNCSYSRIDETLSIFYLDGLSSSSENEKIIFKEKEDVLKSKFSAFLKDIDELKKYKQIVLSFEKSKKIQLMIKLGLLNKF